MKPKQLPYMLLYVNDYIAGTRSMTLAERGAYWDLILFSWARGGPLPNDRKQLAKLLGVPLRQFEEAWQGVREKFDKVPGGLANARLERERAYALAKREKWSERAAKGAKERWHPDSPRDASSIKNDASSINAGHASSISQAMLRQCPPISSLHSPDIRTPDSEAGSARKRARPAGPKGQRARSDGAGMNEDDPEVKRHRAEARALAEQTAAEKAKP
jgi:uncharacterized protein YdaU (DUF1376 family)